MRVIGRPTCPCRRSRLTERRDPRFEEHTSWISSRMIQRPSASFSPSTGARGTLARPLGGAGAPAPRNPPHLPGGPAGVAVEAVRERLEGADVPRVDAVLELPAAL